MQVPESSNEHADAVLVLGATGLVGSRVLRELRSADIPVVAVSRRPLSTDDPGLTWVRADVTDAEAVARIPGCARAISTLAIWLTADLAPALVESGVRRLVAFSSTSAVTKADATDEGERSLAARLSQGEAALHSFAPLMESTILRPTLIYGGAGDRNIERIAAQVQRFRVFPLIDRGRGQRQPVHADDLGVAAVAALFSPAAVGQTYDVAGGEVLTVRDMVTRTAEANGTRVHFLRVPRRTAEAGLRALGRLPRFPTVPSGALERMTRDLVFDTTRASEDFGYTPRSFEPPDYRTTATPGG